jgi:hypothetical protein
MSKKTKKGKNAQMQQEVATGDTGIVGEMLAKLADADAQERLAQEMLDTLSRPYIPPELDHNKITDVLLKSIRQHPLRGSLQNLACACISVILERYVVDKDPWFLRKGDTIELFALAVINHPNDPVVQCSATRCLSWVLKDPDHVLHQLRAPVRATVPALIKSISTYTDDECMMAQGTHIIFALMHQWTTLMRDLPVKQIVGATLAGMRKHSQSVLVQFHACQLFRFIAHNSMACANEIWVQGGMKDIVAALNTFLLADHSTMVFHVTEKFYLTMESEKYDEAVFFLSGLGAINNMYKNGSKPQPEEGLGVIGRVLARHSQQLDVQDSALSAAVQAMHICPKNAMYMGQHGMRAMLAAVATHETSEDVQVAGLKCLYKMMYAGDLAEKYRSMLLADNGLSVINRCLNVQTKTKAVVVAGIKALTSLAQSDDLEIKASIIKAGCATGVAQALLARLGGERDFDLALFGMECMQSMFHARLSDKVTALAVQGQCIDAILQCMSAWKSSLEMQRHGCDAAARIVLSYEPCVQTYGRSLLPIALQAMLVCKDEYPIQSMGSVLLATICQELWATEHRTEIQRELGASVGLKVLFQSLRWCAKVKEDTMAEKTCWMIFYAAHDHDKSKRACKDNHIEAVIQQINTRHADSDAVKRAAGSAYFAITGTMDDAMCVASDTWQQDPRLVCVNTSPKLARSSRSSGPSFERTRDDCGESTKGVREDRHALLVCDDASKSSEASDRRSARHAAEVCDACGKTPSDMDGKPLLRCSACTVAPRYCSAACQQARWGAHKAECKANRKPVK